MAPAIYEICVEEFFVNTAMVKVLINKQGINLKNMYLLKETLMKKASILLTEKYKSGHFNLKDW